MSSIFDVVCVGNAKIDIFLSIHHATSYTRVDRKTNELCVKYGEKIPLDKCVFLLGGNACNVSVGLSKLGFKTALFAEIGDDEFSQKIAKELGLQNVNIQSLIMTKGATSSFSIIIDFQKERTIFAQNFQRENNFSFAGVSTKWVYLTSLGERWEEPYGKTLEFVKQKGIKLAFNPGTLQLEKGYEGIKDILGTTDILFVNKEEAYQITNSKLQIPNKNNESMVQFLENLKNLGPKIVVITDGKNGSFAINEERQFFTQAIVEAEVLEKTGAGDAYASGFLGAIIEGFGIQEAMLWGAKNSSSTIQKLGAQNGLLKKEEIEKQ